MVRNVPRHRIDRHAGSELAPEGRVELAPAPARDTELATHQRSLHDLQPSRQSPREARDGNAAGRTRRCVAPVRRSAAHPVRSAALPLSAMAASPTRAKRIVGQRDARKVPIGAEICSNATRGGAMVSARCRSDGRDDPASERRRRAAEAALIGERRALTDTSALHPRCSPPTYTDAPSAPPRRGCAAPASPAP